MPMIFKTSDAAQILLLPMIFITLSITTVIVKFISSLIATMSIVLIIIPFVMLLLLQSMRHMNL